MEEFMRNVNDVNVGVAIVVSSFWLTLLVGTIYYFGTRGANMTPKAMRDREVKRIIADILTDGFFQARLLPSDDPGHLTVAETEEYAKRFGNILTIADLLPRGGPPLKERLAQKHKMYIPEEIMATAPSKLNGATQPKKSLLAMIESVNK